MRKVNLKDIPEQERKSPKGKFHKFVKNVSVALGREPESLDLASNRAKRISSPTRARKISFTTSLPIIRAVEVPEIPVFIPIAANGRW